MKTNVFPSFKYSLYIFNPNIFFIKKAFSKSRILYLIKQTTNIMKISCFSQNINLKWI